MPTPSPSQDQRRHTIPTDNRAIAARDRTILRHEQTIANSLRTIAKCRREIAEHRQTIGDNVVELANQRKALRLKEGMYLRADTALQALLQLATDLIELKDPYTRGHSSRVSALALGLAAHRGVRFPSSKLLVLKYAALLHDIGKISISDAVLNKPTMLTEAERVMIEQHTVLGHRLLAPLDLDPMIKNAVLCHHENFDGSGYPARLQAEDIPLAARILRVADVYEALTSWRPYRAAFNEAQALEIIDRSRSQFDPRLLEVLPEVPSADPRQEAQSK